jgi:hypothetical protein
MRHSAPPGIRIWTSHGEVYQQGERVRVYFRTERDAFVTILRVDTDGRLRMLYPRQPWEDNLVRGGRTYDLRNTGRNAAFIVDDDPGVGYVFAVASEAPFVYDHFINNDHWDFHVVSDGRIHGDPYVSLEELAGRMFPDGYTAWDTHLLPYHVGRHYDYPRFVCYDCHSYASWVYWNPYRWYCSRFSLYIYYDPYYYYPSYWYPPVYYYGGTRVVYARGQRASRYVFKAREDQTSPAITYRDRRTEPDQRRPHDRGVRGADIGGVGSVPVPGRRTVDAAGVTGGARQPFVTQPDRLPLTGPSSSGRRPAPVVESPSRGAGAAVQAEDDGGRRTTEPAARTARTASQEAGEPSAEERGGRRGVASASAQPAERTDTEPSRTDEPRYSPEPRAVARPEPRGGAAEPRSEPSARPSSREPRGSGTSRPEARPAPRGSPSARPSSPSGGLVRRRP